MTIGAADTAPERHHPDHQRRNLHRLQRGTLALSGGSSFTQAAGTLTLTGTFTENSGTFTQSGGAESGNPVGMTGGTLADSGGTGAFLATGSITLTGTIPSGQTVTVDGAGGTSSANMPSAVTVDGTLTLESGAGGDGDVTGSGSLTVASGGTLTTEGSSEPSSSRCR